MQNRRPNLWKLGGLSLSDLLRRTARASWRDDVFGQGGRMAFYYFLALFPSLLVFFEIGARIPHLGGPMKNALQDLSGQLLPDRVSQLLRQMMDELTGNIRYGVQLISACAGALWAALTFNRASSPRWNWDGRIIFNCGGFERDPLYSYRLKMRDVSPGRLGLDRFLGR